MLKNLLTNEAIFALRSIFERGKMRFVIVFAILAMLASSMVAEVGWCGQIWPNSGSEHPVGEDIAVYFQIWKDGVTPGGGRGEGIAATLYWREAGTMSWEDVVMTYSSDVGNNDEYTGTIPGPASTIDIEYYCEALDSTDMVTTTGTDQNDVALNDSTPGVLHIVNVTEIDVTVTFQVDMSLETVTDVVTVSGSFNDWNTEADTLTDPDMDNVYTTDILFPAGSAPSHEYKYVNSGTYESTPNRSLEIDDSSPTQVLPVVYFENRDPADYTTMDITVHFSVDMSAETVTDPYVAGSVYPLVWGWDVGWNDTLALYDDGAHDDGSAGDGIYGALITFPEGSYRNVEYKYTTDGTDNEPLPPFENHTFELGDSAHQVLNTDVFGEMENVEEADLPEKLNVSVSPNPFNAAAEIGLTLPSAGNVSVDVYDIQGRHLENLVDGYLTEGKHSITWEASQRHSGLYLIRVRKNDLDRTQKLLLVK